MSRREGRVESLHVYPVKGLSGTNLSLVDLENGQGFPGDRVYALARPDGAFDPLGDRGGRHRQPRETRVRSKRCRQLREGRYGGICRHEAERHESASTGMTARFATRFASWHGLP